MEAFLADIPVPMKKIELYQKSSFCVPSAFTFSKQAWFCRLTLTAFGVGTVAGTFMLGIVVRSDLCL